MSAESSPDSNSASALSGDEIAFPNQEAGETFVRTLRDHRAWCTWCLCPLEVSPAVRFTPEGPKDTLETGGSYAEFGGPVRDYPPGEREEHCICRECGRIGIARRESRSKKTTKQALTHIASVLEENGVGVDIEIARETVSEAFAERRTGQFVRTLGEAIYQATD